MPEGKSKGIKLFRVLKELNIARDTLISYLKTEGMVLEDVGPNARLTEEMHDALLRGFATEREAVERHEKRVEQIQKRRSEESDGEGANVFLGDEYDEEPVAETAEAHPVKVEPIVEPEPEPELEPEPVKEEPVIEEPVVEEKEPIEEVVEQEPEVVETPPEPEVVAEEVQEEEPASLEEESQVAIAEATSKETTEKAVEEGEAPVEASTEPTEDKTESPTEDKEETPSSEENKEAASPDTGTIVADRYTLTGPKVLGTVDLSGIGDPGRKKRKRKTKTAATTTETRPTTTQPATDTRDSGRRRNKKKKKGAAVDSEAVEQNLQDTLRGISQGAGGRSRQKRRRQRREEHAERRANAAENAEEAASVLRVMEFISANELAGLMDLSINDVIGACMELGMMVSINQRLDADAITLIAAEFDRDVEFIAEMGDEDLVVEDDDPESLKPRNPVVTVMGHVDHGKTSLLDYIREANVVGGESGGITQHIGAYVVELKDGKEITFLDTPGHEAFTAMRARGTLVTDVVILVVASDDAVMPQTIEAINHAKAGGVPIVVAVNKIDKDGANTDRVMQQLADQNVLVEQWGGQVQCSLVSAITGEGVDDLLEKIHVEAEVLELKANPDRNAYGTIIESRLDKGRGVVATTLVQGGTLRVGDFVVVGQHSGKIRAMFNERDVKIEESGPSEPALILGLDGAPEVGDRLVVLDDEREAKDIASNRKQIKRESSFRQKKHITLDDIGRRLALGNFQELNIVVKGDVAGSVEALKDSLLRLSTDEVQLNIIHSGVGAITEGDVMLASASDAVILGFHVRPMLGAKKLAEQEEIDIRTYSIIYDAIENVRDALEGLLSPELSEKTTGVAEVREVFKVPKLGAIGGSYIVEGKIKRNDTVRLVRDGVQIYEGTLVSLRRFRDDVKEVVSGYECGIGITNYNDIKVGDQIESYEIIETKRSLEV